MILVTGGTGLVGAHLLRSLILRGEKNIRALYRSEESLSRTRRVFGYALSHPDEALKSIDWIRADLLDPVDVSDIMRGIKTVYHCAAIVSFHPRDARKMLVQNPGMTELLVNAALEEGVEAFIHTSSVAALGRTSGSESISEESIWKDSRENSIYARSKYAAEMQVWRGMEEGLNVSILNPTVILGPGNWTSGSSKFFHTFYKGFPFYTLGETGFVDVEDVAEVLIRLREQKKWGQRYIAVGENVSYRRLFTLITNQYKKKAPSILPPDFLTEILWRWEYLRSYFSSSDPLITRETARSARSRYHYDNRKVSEELGMQFTPLKDTVAKYCAMYISDLRDGNHFSVRISKS